MKKDMDPVQSLVITFQTKTFKKTWAEISSNSGLGKRVVKRILQLAEGTLFTRVESDWKLIESINEKDIELFKLTHSDEIKFLMQEWEVAKSQKKKSKPTYGILKLRKNAKFQEKSEIHQGTGSDFIYDKKRQWSDGLTKGKRKLYMGPDGQYWTDPNYTKRES